MTEIAGPPFYANSNDDNHCLQACVRMVLESFGILTHSTWTRLDELTGNDADPSKKLWTWPSRTLLEMTNLGFDVRFYDGFDYQRFSVDGAGYLEDRYGSKQAKTWMRHSDIQHEMVMATKLVERIPVLDEADFEIIEELVRTGFLLILNVNSKALRGLSGFFGHYVLVYDADGDRVTFHDPGLPARPSRQIGYERLDRGWSLYGERRDRNIIALRLQEPPERRA